MMTHTETVDPTGSGEHAKTGIRDEAGSGGETADHGGLRDGDFTGDIKPEEPRQAEIAYQRLRRDYDALIDAVDRLQQHHGLFLLRQAAGTLRPAMRLERKPDNARSSTIPAVIGKALLDKIARGDTASHDSDDAICDRRLRGGAARYYAGILMALLRDLQQRVDDLKALAMIVPLQAARGTRSPQGPGVSQILTESQRLLMQVESDIQPLLTRALTASHRCSSRGGEQSLNPQPSTE